MKFGAQFLVENLDECMESVAVAEKAGFAHAWFSDLQIFWQDCSVYITRLVEARTQYYDSYEGHLGSAADHTAYLTDALIDDFAIGGSAEHCLDKIRVLAELGVWEISSAYYNGRNDQLARVGHELIGNL